MANEGGELAILLFFYPERRDCLRKVVSYLRERGVDVRVLEDRVLRALIVVRGLADVADLVSSVDCISRAGVVISELPRVELGELAKRVATSVENYLRSQGLCVAVRCRRWDKSYPSTSIEIAKAVARELESRGLSVSPKCRDELLVAVDSDRVLVALVRERWVGVREYLPRSIAKRVTCVACAIQGAYEVADLLQLARALGIELVLLDPREEALSSALNLLGMSTLPPEARVVSDFDEVARSVDVSILLSRYGRGNERTLVELAKRFRRVALVVGNEFSDPPPYVRDRCEYSVRLGPETGKPMRSCVALAYALGIVLTSMWGAI